MRTRSLLAVCLVLVLTGLLWSQPAQRPRVFIGLGGEPGPDDNGIVVREVTADGPAARAGIKPGDVISKVGDKPVKGFETMGEAIAGKMPGDKLMLTIVRDGKEQVLELTLAAPSATAQLGPRPGGPPASQPSGGFLGVVLMELTPELKAQHSVAVDKGALITDVMPGSPAAKAELKAGDVVVAMDGTAIETAQALRDAIKTAGAGKKVAFKVARGSKQMDVAVDLEAMTPERLAGRVPGPAPRLLQPERPLIVTDAQRIRELEKKVQDLEKRLTELEKKAKQE
jgi:S1-C subfamily serine protease